MKDYTVDDPKFSKKITITEITDTNHADNINKAPKQVFENTLFLEKSKVSANGGDVSDTIIQSAAAVEDEYPIPVAGDTPKTLLGKTKKFFESIKNWMTGVCLLGHIVNNCVTDRSDLPLSAAQGKALMDAVNVLNTNQKETSKRFRVNDSTCTVMLYHNTDSDIVYRLQIESSGRLAYIKADASGHVIQWISVADLG